MMTSSDFVAKLKDAATNHKTLYVLGCFGAPMNATNKARWMREQAFNRKEERAAKINAATSDTFGFDCVCLLKGILWGWNANKNAQYGGVTYKSNGVPDIGANSIITKCSDISTTGWANMVPGELLWMDGHVGVYVGDGLAVECTHRWKDGVQLTAVHNIGKKSGYEGRSWTKHGKLPYVSYEVATKPQAPATAEFSPRLSRPEAGNPYYNTKNKGGYSNAIKGSPTDSGCDVLSNCVGYAYGRFNEIGGYGSCKYLKPVNAENFIQYKGDLEVGQEPRLGACMVWRKGATLSGSDGAGHVAIVEKIVSATEVVTSESGWGSSTPFWTKTRKKGTDGRWGSGSAYTFLGFIYNPAVPADATVPKDEPTTPAASFKVGDVVEFTGTTHYVSANAKTGPSCKPGKAKITSVYPSGKHPYHLVRVAGAGSTVWGWVDAADIKVESETQPSTPVSSGEIKVGDVVEFTGSTHYTNAYAKSGYTCKPGKAKVHKIYQLGKAPHPYSLIKVAGGGSTVYGWVDEKDVAPVGTSEAPAEQPAASIKVGDKVRVSKGAKTYDGRNLASFVYNRDHIVKEISGDRAVIVYTGIVVAAVKVSDLYLV